MKTRALGQTGLLVSELGFGVFAAGAQGALDARRPGDDRTAMAAIHVALDMGYTFFDTAYGNGQSEALLGRALRQAGKTHGLVIASRVGEHSLADTRRNSFTPGAIVRSLEGCLARMGRDYIDLYRLHHPPPRVLAQGSAPVQRRRLMQPPLNARATELPSFAELERSALAGA